MYKVFLNQETGELEIISENSPYIFDYESNIDKYEMLIHSSYKKCLKFEDEWTEENVLVY